MDEFATKENHIRSLKGTISFDASPDMDEDIYPTIAVTVKWKAERVVAVCTTRYTYFSVCVTSNSLFSDRIFIWIQTIVLGISIHEEIF
jgi:hypothetical protein